MNRVSSVNIQKARYCPIRKLLEVQFKGEDTIYQYYDVPEEVWHKLKSTASMDMYFNIEIATCYRMKCVNKLKKR